MAVVKNDCASGRGCSILLSALSLALSGLKCQITMPTLLSNSLVYIWIYKSMKIVRRSISSLAYTFQLGSLTGLARVSLR